MHPVFSAPETRYVFGLEPLPAHCFVALLAVPDGAVPEVAHELAAQGPAPEGCAAFHLSGALPTDVLAPLHAAGYSVGAFHPWVLASRWVGSSEALEGARVGVTASHDALRTARAMAAMLGASVVPIPAARRAVADAAVAMTSAYLPILLERTLPLLEEAGLDRDEALAALVPLARSVLGEVERSGVGPALEAVLERTDPEALGVHLRTLEGDERRLYTWLGQEAARLAEHRDAAEGAPGRSTHFQPVSGA